MNKKRKIIMVIILVILSFAVFLTVRYYHKYVIHKNIDLLKSFDSKTRQDAVKKLADVGEPAVEPLLFALNYDPSYVKNGTMGIVASVIKQKKVKKIAENISIETHNLKMGAIETLGLIGDPRAVDPLVNILLEEENYRDNASRALGRIGAPSVSPLLLHKNYPDEKVKIAIIETLGKTHSAEAVPALIDFLRERDENFEDNATGALKKIGKPAVEPLGKVLFNDKESLLLRCRIISILGSIGGTDSTRLILKSAGEEQIQYTKEIDDELAKIDSRETIPILIERLKLPKKEIICKAASLLENYNDRSLVRNYIELLSYNNIYTRYQAICLLQKYKSPESVEPLIERLNDEDYEVRAFAAESLGIIGDSRAVVPLAEAMGKTETTASYEIRTSLVKLNDKRCVEILLRHLKNKKLEWTQKCDLIGLLGELKDYRATDPIIGELESNDESIREAAIKALGEIRDKKAVAPLIEILNRTKYRKQQGIIAEALGSIGDRRAVGPLIHALNNNCEINSDNSDYILTALGQVKDPVAYNCLMSVLKENKYKHKADALSALGYYHKPEVIEIIRNAVKDNDQHIRVGAVKGMCNMNSPDIIPDLIETLKDESSQVREYAIGGLSEMDNPVVVDHLIKIVEGSDPRSKWFAVEILGNRKDPRAAEPLVWALHTGSNAFQERIIVALLMIGEPSRKYLMNYKKEFKIDQYSADRIEKALKDLDDPDSQKKAEGRGALLDCMHNQSR